MIISSNKIKELSDDIRRIIDGQSIDIRDNKEGLFSILKNDIHTLAMLKNEQVDALQTDKEKLKETLANISHQLKTPLTSMLIMIDLIEDALPEKRLEFINNIRISLTHTEWLVSSLLKMAKLDADAVEFIFSEYVASDIVNLALEPLNMLLDIKNQSVNILGDNIKFRCDRRWTAEALNNIIKNASEYSPEGSVLTISAGTNPMSSWLSVTDCGNGIATNDIPKLFKRYKGSRSEKGYGVGLALSLAIMKRQNGDIEVDGGGNGIGATFTIKLFK